MTSQHCGPLALVGGNEWGEGCSFDADLLAASGGTDVLVVPTAAAYEHPERAVESAARWFRTFGGVVTGLGLFSRADASDPAVVAQARQARFIYLGGGSPLHLRSVLKQSPVWQAMEEAWRDGAVLAGSSAGAMVLGDPMVDPRGGAFTLGLGLIEQMAVLPHASSWSPERMQRTVSLTSSGVALLAIDERTAVVRAPDGNWSVSGVGSASVFVDGAAAGIDALPG